MTTDGPGIGSEVSDIDTGSRVEELDVAPPSFAQQRLWFLDRLHPGSILYNVPLVSWLRGAVDRDALAKALTAVQRRHESLRTTFEVIDDELVQVIGADAQSTLSFADLSDSPEDDRLSLVEARVSDVIMAPFDLEQGPLLRAALIRTKEDEHVLAVVFHHIVSDGWSIGVFHRELADCYTSFLAGSEPHFPDLPIQYADFAIWQREFLAGEELDRQIGYWRSHLDSAQHVDLPTDRPRPPFQTFAGGLIAVPLPADASDRLIEFCNDRNVTPSMVTQTAFAALLQRYAGQDDITVGIPIANRNRSELEGLIGFFVNSLPIRTDLSGDPSFTAAITRVRDVSLEAYGHQDLPFEKLVEELHPARDPSRHPIFQVWFAFQNIEVGEMRLGDVSVEPFSLGIAPTRYDLELHVWYREGAYSLLFFYNTDLFDRNTIERMSGHYVRLLESAAADPQMRLSELPMMSQSEEAQLEEWNNTKVDLSSDATLTSLFEAQVRRTPEAVAVRLGEEAVTYAELDDRANALALRLRGAGVDRGRRVAVYMERSIELLVSLYGIEKAGGAYVPLEPGQPVARLTSMVETAEPDVILTQAHLLDAARSLANEGGCDPEVWVVGSEGADAVVEMANGILAEGVGARPDDMAYVIFTSGSTGQPKGVMVSHRAVCNRLQWMQSEYPIGAGDRVLQKTPFGFDVSVWELFWPLQVGAELVLAEPEGHKDPRYLAELISGAGITTLHFVPSMLQVFLTETEVEEWPVKRVFSSGEALSGDLARAFLTRFGDTELHNLYGPTEAAIDVTYYQCRLEDERANVPIGRPVANTQVHVLDENLRRVPVGVYGELYLGGVQVALGYLGRPDLTEERFVADPWAGGTDARMYRTGDVVRYLPDGNLEFKGRSDFQVKIRGNRIECGEIEAALLAQASVQQAVVIAREDEPGDARLVAYVVPEPSVEEGGTHTLRDALLEMLPGYMVPSAFVALPEMPLTPSGKLNRKALPAPEVGRDSLGTRLVPPSNETEERLVAIWAKILGIEELGVEDDFFELGGHSLLATQLVSRVREEFDVEIPLRLLFERPTVAGLGRHIMSATWAAHGRNESETPPEDYEVGEL